MPFEHIRIRTPPPPTPTKPNNPQAFLFSIQERKELHQIYETFSTSANNSISASSLNDLLNSIGKHPTVDELNALVIEIDEDNSGEIDFNEFLTLITKLDKMDQTNLTSMQLKTTFNIIDLDRDGIISMKELNLFFSGLAKNGGTFLKEIEADPEASLKQRCEPWTAYEGAGVMAVGHELALGGGMGTEGGDNEEEEKGIDFEEYVKIVRALDL